MINKKLYVISGCNGAGKTTASFNMLPDLLNCKEFVNADEIARGISPFQPEKVSIEAGRLMLKRISELMTTSVDFSFETTLATRSFVNTIRRAKANGYYVTLIFFWLESEALAFDRVKKRVLEGGHHIEPVIISRRYKAGIKNLFQLYAVEVDYLMIYDNSNIVSELVAEKEMNKMFKVHDPRKFQTIKSTYDER